MHEVVWKQAEVNEPIKNVKCQPIHCIHMKAGKKSAQATQNLLGSAEVVFWKSPASL